MIRLWQRGIMGIRGTVFAFALAWIAALAVAGEFPGAHWQTVAPAEVGLDEGKLREISEYFGGRGCVVRHGRMVFTWGDAARRGDVASAAKPVYAHLLYAALEEGLLDSLDTPVKNYVPELAELNAALGQKDAAMTFAQMATQTSCYGVREAPGAAFNYNDWQMELLVDTLLLKIYGTTWENADDEVLRARLGDVLQFEDAPTLLAFGTGNRPGRLAISPRDFARIGLLYLHEGRWEERHLIARERARRAVRDPLPNSVPQSKGEAAELIAGRVSLGSRAVPDNQTDHRGSYSWLWWVNGVDRGGRRLWPDAPADVFAALGHANGQRGMTAIPSLDVVIAWNDTTMGERPAEPHPLNAVFKLLAEAAADAPMPGQIIVDPERPAWLARSAGAGIAAGAEAFYLCGAGDPEDFLYRGELTADGTREGDQEDIIGRMRGTGANAIYIQAVRSHGGDGAATHNPFVGHDPARGVNEAVLAQWERWLRELDEAGIVTYFFIYDDNCAPWGKGGDAVGAEEEEFVRTLARRFGHHRNLIWCIAEEYEEALTAAKASRLAALLREADEHDHPIAVYKLNGLEFGEFAEDASVDQFAIQYNVAEADELNRALGEAFRRAEGQYGITLAEAAGWGTGEELRRNVWACALAGAGSMVLGWTFDGENNPARADLEACGRLVRFMEEVDPRGLAPRNELAAGATRWLAGNEERGWIGYVVRERGDSGTIGAAGVTGLVAGEYLLRWYDPANGEWMGAEEELLLREGEKEMEFKVPTAGGTAGNGDAVFWLRRLE